MILLAELLLLQILHLCTEKSVCTTNFEPFGEIGANFPVQLSSRSHFANIGNKKVSSKINVIECEKALSPSPVPDP